MLRAVAVVVLLLPVAGCLSGPAGTGPDLGRETAMEAYATLLESGSLGEHEVLWLRGSEWIATDEMRGPTRSWDVGLLEGGALTTRGLGAPAEEPLHLVTDEQMRSTWPALDLDDVIDSDKAAAIALGHLGIEQVEPGWGIGFWLYQTPIGPEWTVSHSAHLFGANPIADRPVREEVILDATTGEIRESSGLPPITYQEAIDAAGPIAGDYLFVVDAMASETEHWYTMDPWPIGEVLPTMPDHAWGDGKATLWYLVMRDHDAAGFRYALVRGDGATMLSAILDLPPGIDRTPYVDRNANDARFPEGILDNYRPTAFGSDYLITWENGTANWIVRYRYDALGPLSSR